MSSKKCACKPSSSDCCENVCPEPQPVKVKCDLQSVMKKQQFLQDNYCQPPSQQTSQCPPIQITCERSKSPHLQKPIKIYKKEKSGGCKCGPPKPGPTGPRGATGARGEVGERGQEGRQGKNGPA